VKERALAAVIQSPLQAALGQRRFEKLLLPGNQVGLPNGGEPTAKAAPIRSLTGLRILLTRSLPGFKQSDFCSDNRVVGFAVGSKVHSPMAVGA
jgi:hypothetical protein